MAHNIVNHWQENSRFTRPRLPMQSIAKLCMSKTSCICSSMNNVVVLWIFAFSKCFCSEIYFNLSMCEKGFIVDNRCGPLLFGKGFGPKAYQELFDSWTNVHCNKQRDAFSPQTISCIERLKENLDGCRQIQVREEVLSSLVACSLQEWLACDGNRRLAVVHQDYSRSKKHVACADIAIRNFDKANGPVHALMEMKFFNISNEQ